MYFRLPTRTLIGPGALSRLDEAAGSLGGTIALVTDEALEATPWPDRVRALLADRTLVTLNDIEPNPRTDTVDRLADQARKAGATGVVAIGGGSVLDAAKGIALLLTNTGGSRDYEGRNRFKNQAAPLVAVPTTCGTGSEVTWVSVLTVAEENRKISVKGDGLFPTRALVDSDLLATLPPALVASTGMDALTHAVEAYISNVSNPASDALAEKAVLLLMDHLSAAVSDITGNAVAREAVMRASTLAGMAFGNADVGAVHCLSESMGGLFDVPHGLANAILLAPVLRAHGDAAVPRLAALARRTGLSVNPDDTAASERFIDRIVGLGSTTGIPDFSGLRIPATDYDTVAAMAETNGSNGSNPRAWAAADYRAVLESLSPPGSA